MSSTDAGNIAESKAAKKNKKRKNKKTETSEESSNAPRELTSAEMLAVLKAQLEEAKANKDFKKCSELRDQVWVLSDIVAGVRTRIDDKELNRIIESIHKQFHPESTAVAAADSRSHDDSSATAAVPSAAAAVPSLTAASVPSAASAVVVEDKKMKALRKKLEQIEVLKTRQSKGEKLEKNQIEKIKSEDSVKQEIREMEELLQSVLVMKH